MKALRGPGLRPAGARASTADANAMSRRVARLRTPGFIVAAFLALAGCAGSQVANTAQRTSQVAAAGASTPASTGAGASAPSTLRPADLVGLDGPALEHLLGKPGLVRRDYPAEVWQYRNPGCVLDVYLYHADDHLTVTHAEARAPEIAGDPLSPCIAKLAELKHKATG